MELRLQGWSLPPDLPRNWPELPGWIVPNAGDVEAVLHLAAKAHKVRGTPAEAGCFLALRWAWFDDDKAPISKSPFPPNVKQARAESWLACSVAAGCPLPTDLDYRRIGVSPLLQRRLPEERRDIERGDAAFAFGVWTGLDWLLGRRGEPTVPVPSDEPGGEVIVPAPDPDPEKWQEITARWTVEYRQEAREHWTRLRALADAQVAPESCNA